MRVRENDICAPSVGLHEDRLDLVKTLVDRVNVGVK
jgi:hypothetical protein